MGGGMKHIVVFDLDGTLSDGRHRLPLLPAIEDRSRDSAWINFSLAAIDDTPITDNISLLRMLSIHYDIIILTGRGAVSRDITIKWLRENYVPYDRLIMRPIGDCRPDTEFKEAMLKQIGLGEILCCFDDLKHVANHIRSLGVTCHLVTDYEFI